MSAETSTLRLRGRADGRDSADRDIALGLFSSGVVAPITLSYEHAKIHDGKTFHAGKYVANLASAGSAGLLMVTPATIEPHIMFSVASSAEARIELLRDVAVSGSGVAVGAFNMDRDNATAASLGVYYGPVISGSNVVAVFDELLPGGAGKNQGSGGTLRSGAEWILKPSSGYIIRATNNGTGAQNMSVSIEWYEEAV